MNKSAVKAGIALVLLSLVMGASTSYWLDLQSQRFECVFGVWFFPLYQHVETLETVRELGGGDLPLGAKRRGNLLHVEYRLVTHLLAFALFAILQYQYQLIPEIRSYGWNWLKTVIGFTVLVVLGGLAINLVARLILGREPDRGWLNELAQTCLFSPWPATVRIIDLVLIAPITEELIFRGLLLGLLSIYMRPALAVLLQSLVFGVMHYNQNLLGVCMAALGGALFAIVYILTGKLRAPMLVHGLGNLAETVRHFF